MVLHGKTAMWSFGDVLTRIFSGTALFRLLPGPLDGAPRCLVDHPGSPPFLIQVIEIVPSAHTAAASIECAREIYTRCALKPVVLNKEIKGFIFNRLQAATL